MTPSVKHYSDCAVHNAPASPAGECDCGGYTDQSLQDIKDFERAVNLAAQLIRTYSGIPNSAGRMAADVWLAAYKF